MAVFRRELALTPNSVEAHYGLAVAYAGIGRVGLGDAHLAIAEHPDADPLRRFDNRACGARVRGDGDGDGERLSRPPAPSNRRTTCSWRTWPGGARDPRIGSSSR